MLYLVSPYYGFFSYLNACALKSISHPRNAHMHPYTHCISAVFVCQSATISSCGFAAITPNNKKNCYRITEIPTSESKRQGVRKESLPLFHNVFFFFGSCEICNKLECRALVCQSQMPVALRCQPFYACAFCRLLHFSHLHLCARLLIRMCEGELIACYS